MRGIPIPILASSNIALMGGAVAITPALVQYAEQTVADGSQAAVAQVLTNTIDVPTTITGSGNVNLEVRAKGFNGGVPLVIPQPLLEDDDATLAAARIGDSHGALHDDPTFAAFFTASHVGDDVIITFNNPANNDPWALFTITPTTATGINASSSTITTAGNAAGCQADFVGCNVSGAGTAAANGTYPQKGVYTGKSYYNLAGVNPLEGATSWGGSDQWNIFSIDGLFVYYISTDGTQPLPWLESYTAIDGDSPAPTVTPILTPCTAGDQVFIGISYDSSATIDTAVFVGGGAGTLSIVVDGDNNEAKITNGDITTAWYRGTATGGETGVQFITDSAVRISIQAVEFSGVSSAAAEDTDTNSGNNATMSFDAVTPSSARNVVLGIAAYANATDAYSSGPDAPFTRFGAVGGNGVYQEVVYTIQESATAQGSNMDVVLTGAKDFVTANVVLGGA